jgi:hypothetical protein
MSAGAEITLRAIGAFYVFAGIVGMRAMVMDHLLDQMLAGITLKPIPQKEHHRRWLLIASTLAIGMGGMALMVLNLWAVPLFLFGAATQAFYLIWARQTFPVEDDVERTGRRQTTNAALIYFGATALVCLAAAFGLLRDWLDPWAALVPLAGLGLLLVGGRHFLWRPRQLERWTEPEPVEPDPLAPPRAVALHPNWGGTVLADADRDEWLDYDLFVPPDLADRIWRWGNAFHAGDDHEVKEFWVQFADATHEAAHRAEGEAIVAELRTIFGDEEAFGPVYPADVRYGPEAL